MQATWGLGQRAKVLHRRNAAGAEAWRLLETSCGSAPAELLAVKTQMEVLQSKLSKAEELLEQMQDANNALIQERKVWRSGGGCHLVVPTIRGSIC